MSLKYRRLSKEELNELEKEFIDFLVINGITADEWEEIKRMNQPKAERIIDLFSDVIFEGVFRKAAFGEHVSSGAIYCFRFLEKEIQLLGLEDSTGELDFTQQATLDQLKESIPDGLKIFHQTKNYQKKREEELFDMSNRGVQLTDGKLFKQLSLLYASSQKQ